jgi:KaiC/GvpD/RAD55 family RecA-like ATPase
MELTFMTYGEFKINAIIENFDPIIENFLNRKEFMLLHATSKTGKSMLALNIGLAIATGRDFLGMPTSKSKVLYLQTEIANFSLKERIEKMLENLDTETYDNASTNLLISSNRIRIDESEGIELIKYEIKKYQPNLLIIDPLYDLHRKNEDNATDMAPILSDIREIARSCDCAIILIHHQGKKGEHNGGNAGHACRGSSAFGDVPDISISLTKDKNGFNLKGIFRNRPSIDDLRIKFHEESLLFELEEFVPKPAKTKDVLLQILTQSSDGLTKKQICDEAYKKSGVTKSAILKQFENLRDRGQLATEGTFKDTKFRLLTN